MTGGRVRSAVRDPNRDCWASHADQDHDWKRIRILWQGELSNALAM